MSKLLQLVQTSNWENLRLCLGSSQSAFQCTTCNKSSPYFKCANCNSFNMSSFASQITKSDREGRTPLHYACANIETPSDIIRTMVDLSDPPNSVLIQTDNAGNIPLHGACATGSLATVKTLLGYRNNRPEKLREMIKIKNELGFTAMDAAWNKYLVHGFVLYDEVPTETITITEHITHVLTFTDGIHGLNKRLRNLWGITGILIYAWRYGTSDTLDLMLGFREWRILHEIAGSGGTDRCYCPNLVLYLAIQLFPSQVQGRDKLGFLPLHHAASSPPPRNSIVDINFPDLDEGIVSLLEQANKSAIDILVENYPRGASVPEVEGRLPLNLAIEAGKTWEDGVGALVRAAPQALATRDIKTHMFPFMLAETVEGDCLDFVFCLLRQNPEVVKIGIVETRQEAYLSKKLAILKMKKEEEIASLHAEIYQLKATTIRED